MHSALIRRIFDLIHCSGALSKTDELDCYKYAEIGKRELSSAGEDVVEAAAGRPILNSKSCDGTPTSIARRISGTLNVGHNGERWGRSSCEFLVHHQFMRTTGGGGDVVTRCVLQDPLTLGFGKTDSSLQELIVISIRKTNKVILGFMG